MTTPTNNSTKRPGANLGVGVPQHPVTQLPVTDHGSLSTPAASGPLAKPPIAIPQAVSPFDPLSSEWDHQRGGTADEFTEAQLLPPDDAVYTMQRPWWYWPEYFISMGVHLLLIFVLAWITISNYEPEAFSLSLSAGDSVSSGTELVQLDPQVIAIESEIEVFEPAPTPPQTTLTNLMPNTELALKSALASDFASAARLNIDPSKRITSGRTGESKEALLKRFGGTPDTEAAVRRGLEWLKKQQSTDGTWSMRGPYRDGASFDENRNAATAMALLAFAGAGSTHLSGEYKQIMQPAVRWLAAQQTSEGCLADNVPHHHLIYTHAQATLVLCELLAMSDDSWLVPYCEKAVRYLQRAQGSAGGWRYEFKGDSDTSVTGWCLMALISGQSAGIEVEPEVLRGVGAWLGRVDSDYSTEYAYARGSGPTVSMTAEGLLCRMYLGWPRKHPSLDKATYKLLKNAPFKGESQAYYYWYYATQVMHHVGGKDWEKWNSAMRVQLPALQVSVDPEYGSWPPALSGPDRTAGRLYATCLAIYCLEVYYRHLPIYSEPSSRKTLAKEVE